jgi:hypothetical protein
MVYHWMVVYFWHLVIILMLWYVKNNDLFWDYLSVSTWSIIATSALIKWILTVTRTEMKKRSITIVRSNYSLSKLSSNEDLKFLRPDETSKGSWAYLKSDKKIRENNLIMIADSDFLIRQSQNYNAWKLPLWETGISPYGLWQ